MEFHILKNFETLKAKMNFREERKASYTYAKNVEITSPAPYRDSMNNSASSNSSGYSSSSPNFKNSFSRHDSSKRSNFNLNYEIIEKLISFVEQGLENRISKIEKISKKNKLNIKKCKKEMKKAEARISKFTIMDDEKKLTDKIKLYFKLVKCSRGGNKKPRNQYERKNSMKKASEVKRNFKRKNSPRTFYVDNDLQALKSYSYVLKERKGSVGPGKSNAGDDLRRSETVFGRTQKKHNWKREAPKNTSQMKIWDRLYGLAHSNSKSKSRVNCDEERNSRSVIKGRGHAKRPRVTPKKPRVSNKTTPRSTRNVNKPRRNGRNEGGKKLLPIRKTRAQILKEKRLEEKLKKGKEINRKRSSNGHKEWVGIGRREERSKMSRNSSTVKRDRKSKSRVRQDQSRQKQTIKKVNKRPIEAREELHIEFESGMRKVSTASFGFIQKSSHRKRECKQDSPEFHHSDKDYNDIYMDKDEKFTIENNYERFRHSSPDSTMEKREESFIKTNDYYLNLIQDSQNNSYEQRIEFIEEQDPDSIDSRVLMNKAKMYVRSNLPVIEQRSIEDDEEYFKAQSRLESSRSFGISYREDDSSEYGLDESSLNKIAKSNICLGIDPDFNPDKDCNYLSSYDKIEEERMSVMSMLDKSLEKNHKEEIEAAEAILSFYTDKSSRQGFSKRIHQEDVNTGQHQENNSEVLAKMRKESLGKEDSSMNQTEEDESTTKFPSQSEMDTPPTSSFRQNILKKRGIQFRMKTNMMFKKMSYEENTPINNMSEEGGVTERMEEAREKSAELLSHTDFLSFRGGVSLFGESSGNNYKKEQNRSEYSMLQNCSPKELATSRNGSHIADFELTKREFKEDKENQGVSKEPVIEANEDENQFNTARMDSFNISCSHRSRNINKEDFSSNTNSLVSHTRPLKESSANQESLKSPTKPIDSEDRRAPLQPLDTRKNSRNANSIPNQNLKIDLDENSLIHKSEACHTGNENVSQLKQYLSLRHHEFSENDIMKSLELFNSIPVE